MVGWNVDQNVFQPQNGETRNFVLESLETREGFPLTIFRWLNHMDSFILRYNFQMVQKIYVLNQVTMSNGLELS